MITLLFPQFVIVQVLARTIYIFSSWLMPSSASYSRVQHHHALSRSSWTIQSNSLLKQTNKQMNKQTYKQQQPYQVRYPVRLKYTNVFVFIIVAENFKLFMQEVRWLMYIN